MSLKDLKKDKVLLMGPVVIEGFHYVYMECKIYKYIFCPEAFHTLAHHNLWYMFL